MGRRRTSRTAVLAALLPALLTPWSPVTRGTDPARPLPRVSVADARVTEGAAARVVLTLDRPAARDVTLTVDTRADTASGRSDYEPVHGLVVAIPAGRTRLVVAVPTLADGLDEAREFFRVRLSDVRRAVPGEDRATVEVVDADPLPGVAPQDAAVAEPALGHRLGFTEVRLSAPSGRQVVVSLVTRPGTAGLTDFVRLYPTVVFEPGQTSQLVSIEVLSDDEVEGPETVRLVVTGARHARATRAATVTIVDADS